MEFVYSFLFGDDDMNSVDSQLSRHCFSVMRFWPPSVFDRQRGSSGNTARIQSSLKSENVELKKNNRSATKKTNSNIFADQFHARRA